MAFFSCGFIHDSDCLHERRGYEGYTDLPGHVGGPAGELAVKQIEMYI